MKKIGLIIGLALIVLIVAIQFAIPEKKSIILIKETKSVEDAVKRHVLNKKLWSKWWPGKLINDSTYTYENNTFAVHKIMLNGFQTTMHSKKDSIKGFLQITTSDNNITQLQWISEVQNGTNPISKIKSYLNQKKWNTKMEQFLNSLKLFFDDEEKVYGSTFKMERTTDFSLLVLKKITAQPPTMKEVYDQINIVKKYVTEIGGTQKNPPMYNLYQDAPNVYQYMVAIPTTKDLPGKGAILFKQLIEGNIVTTSIKGGLATVKNAEAEIQNYIMDHRKTSPAMPYQSLITNRIEETDTTKWVTKLFYPVFY